VAHEATKRKYDGGGDENPATMGGTGSRPRVGRVADKVEGWVAGMEAMEVTEGSR
jgi:hypothetical protein